MPRYNRAPDSNSGELTQPLAPPLAIPNLRIISTAQRGVAQAALRAARASGFQTGGFMTRSFGTLDGPRPEFASSFGVTPLNTRRAEDRLTACVRAGDASLLFVTHETSDGTQKVLAMLRERQIPYRVVPYRTHNGNPFATDSELLSHLALTVDWLMQLDNPRTLHVWGPSTARIGMVAETWFAGLFTAYRTVTQESYDAMNNAFTNIEVPDPEDTSATEGQPTQAAPARPNTGVVTLRPGNPGITNLGVLRSHNAIRPRNAVALVLPTDIPSDTEVHPGPSETAPFIIGNLGGPILRENEQWRGLYSSQVCYFPGNVVHVGDVCYVAISDTAIEGIAPSSTNAESRWSAIATLEEDNQWSSLR